MVNVHTGLVLPFSRREHVRRRTAIESNTVIISGDGIPKKPVAEYPDMYQVLFSFQISLEHPEPKNCSTKSPIFR